MLTNNMQKITNSEARIFLLPRHYAGRNARIQRAYGWFFGKESSDRKLMAVCAFGRSASPHLYSSVCGEKWADHVTELVRLCRREELVLPLSMFVGYCLRDLSGDDLIVVSFADTAMRHNGYIYQATNFIYTGRSQETYARFDGTAGHSRHRKSGDERRIVDYLKTAEELYELKTKHGLSAYNKKKNDLGYSYSKALGFFRIYKTMIDCGIGKKTVLRIGWSKMATLTRVLTRENKVRWLKFAYMMSLEDVSYAVSRGYCPDIPVSTVLAYKRLHERKETNDNFRLKVTEKHRYIYFCTRNKKLRKEWLRDLKLPILRFPKGENQKYKPGEYHRPVVVSVKDKED